MKGIISLLVLAAVLMPAAAVTDDYAAGYYDAAQKYHAAGFIEGSLNTIKILLNVMDDTANDRTANPLIRVFAEAFVSTLSETYNDMATEYNAVVPQINSEGREVVGDKRFEDIKLDRAAMFW